MVRMRGAILIHGAVALSVLLAIDRLWPAWPVHIVAGMAAIVVVVIAALAMVAAGRR
jgi:hypothetical protein